MKTLVALSLIFLSQLTLAQLPPPPATITLSWSVPTQRENGDTLTANEIAGYEINDSCGVTVEITGNTTSYTLPIVLPFDCTFSIVAVDTDGLRSQVSNEITVRFNAPNAPTLNEIQIN